MSEDQLLCRVASLEATLEELQKQIQFKESQLAGVLLLIREWGTIDGAHHKQWVLDQILRTILPGTNYDEWILKYEQEYSEDDMYEKWDQGISP